MNANLCSAAIWPEMGASAALTTGSEAESISAHFLDHLVPHPKRGKYGLYHSPTLSFLSLHCWLRAAGTGTRHPGRVSTRACCGAAWEGSALGPHLAPLQGFALMGREQRAVRSQGPSTQAREGRLAPARSVSSWQSSAWAPGPPPPAAWRFSVAPASALRVTSLFLPLPFPTTSTTFCFLVQTVMILLLHCSFLPNRSLRTVQVLVKDITRHPSFLITLCS